MSRGSKLFIVVVAIVLVAVIVFILWTVRQDSEPNTRQTTPQTTQQTSPPPQTKDSVRIDTTTPRIKDSVRIDTSTPRIKPRIGARRSIELPEYEPNDSLIWNPEGRYTLQYSPYYRSALWIAYKLTASDLTGGAGRSSSFTWDRVLAARGFVVARNEDYSKSGYDKGHLLPSADRQSQAEQNRATFILSNCSPQLPALNRGTWKSLEESVRALCQSYDTLYIVVGVVIDRPLGRLGKNEITIPRLFFKAFLARRGDHFTQHAYLMPNIRDIEPDMEQYRVGIDRIEGLTGLHLFPRVSLK